MTFSSDHLWTTIGDMNNRNTDFCNQVDTYEMGLLKVYGAVIGGHDLSHVLGYPSAAAFRQAVHRKTVPVPTFKRPGFRMRFARTRDIAKWLVSVGTESEVSMDAKDDAIATHGVQT